LSRGHVTLKEFVEHHGAGGGALAGKMMPGLIAIDADGHLFVTSKGMLALVSEGRVEQHWNPA
ncbi:hypothetical protein ABTI15_19965, partial [Acinetobacter baumannii]